MVYICLSTPSDSHLMWCESSGAATVMTDLDSKLPETDDTEVLKGKKHHF